MAVNRQTVKEIVTGIAVGFMLGTLLIEVLRAIL